MAKRFFNICLTLSAMMFMMSSCITTKQVAYLQDMKHDTQIQLENKFEAVISPYDEISILVSCSDAELAKPFNLNMSEVTGTNGVINYLVDQYGNIDFPVFGSLHVAGMTRLQLQQFISDKLINEGYIRDPFVLVRFQNFKVFFLGSNGGKAITITNERCTFLEALAMSGDLNVFTDRSKIAVMREIDGKMVMHYLDPRDSKVFEDPFYMLQQNDFIITRDRGYKNFMESTSQVLTMLGYVSSFVSLITAMILLAR